MQPKKRTREEAQKLYEIVHAEIAQGGGTKEVCERHGVSDGWYYSKRKAERQRLRAKQPSTTTTSFEQVVLPVAAPEPDGGNHFELKGSPVAVARFLRELYRKEDQ